MKRLWILSIVAALLIPSAGAFAAPAEGVSGHKSLRKQIRAVRRATKIYKDVSVAEAHGYESTIECVEEDGLGGMGVHYLNMGLLGDLSVDKRKPELLLYEPYGDGFKLVGVEYLVLALANTPDGPVPWFDTEPPPDGFFNDQAPVLFGQTFAGPMPGHGEGEPWHYELHAWVWKKNPAGLFADFNPRVSCPAPPS
jgi:hypothetical protein